MSNCLGPDFPCPEEFSPRFLCPDEPALWPVAMEDSRQPALLKHVEGCLACQQKVAAIREEIQAIQQANWTDTPRPPHRSAPEELPEAIGEYTILARLGSGGQADVYRAWHPRLKTDVVIKWFRGHAFPEGGSPAFTTEARMLSTIRHPYLVRIFDVGVEQGRPYILMEYVSGQTFSTWLRRFQPSTSRIATVLAKVARAVDAVHQHGFLHLDLKPGNILVDETGNPRVIDFGMARVPENGRLCSWLLAPGTPEYMSPEQYAGDSARISTASDVYGLGAVLFAALSLQPIRSEELGRLEPDWSLIQSVPWGLRRICRKALATRSNDRWESAALLAQELDSFADNQFALRRRLSVACFLIGLASCYAGMISSPPAPPLAILDIQSHRQWDHAHRTVFETKCAAVLDDHRSPCLMVATANTPPVTTTLKELVDAEIHTAMLAEGITSLQFDNTAGPHLILACANRERRQLPTTQLAPLLQHLQSCSSEHSIRILLNEKGVTLLPESDHQVGGSETQQRNTALKLSLKLQSSLDQYLPNYSGMVVIPACSPMLASIP